MPGLVTEASAARLRQLLAAGRTTPGKPSRLPVPGRRFVIAKCTSATAAGGADPVGAECYPAVIMGMTGDDVLADQEELGTVWLTVISGGAAVAPTADAWYEGMFSGTFDPDPTGASDERPRVFAVGGTASADTAISTLEGSGDTSGSLITVDDTWTDTGCNLTVPATGSYFISMTVSARAKVSATPPGIIKARVYDSTAAAAVGTNGVIWVVTTQVANMQTDQSATLTMFSSLTAGHSLRIEALRVGGPTWTTSTIFGSTTGTLTRLNIQKLNL